MLTSQYNVGMTRLRLVHKPKQANIVHLGPTYLGPLVKWLGQPTTNVNEPAYYWLGLLVKQSC